MAKANDETAKLRAERHDLHNQIAALRRKRSEVDAKLAQLREQQRTKRKQAADG